MLRALICSALICGAVAAEADDRPRTTTIDLITIGPGDHLYTRFGHTAIMVMKTRPGEKAFESVVYNYGDADFDDPEIVWKFLRGTLRFRLAVVGSLEQLVGLYAREDRSIFHQRFALSAGQVARVERALRAQAHPDRREYAYHYRRALCSTKVRDLIDEATGGAVRDQLAPRPDPHPTRTYGHRGFAGFPLVEIAYDLFMGRPNDLPQSEYDALYVPSLLSEYLRRVEVPDPAGGPGRVPLLSAPEPLYQRRAPAPGGVQGRSLVPLAWIGLLAVLGLGIWAALPRPPRPARAGIWLLSWALPCGLVGGAVWALAIYSSVEEIRLNELALVLPATDLALLPAAFRWLGGAARAGRWLRAYAWARLGLLLLVAAGHAAGLLLQQPRVLVALSLLASVLLVLITRRLGASPMAARADQQNHAAAA